MKASARPGLNHTAEAHADIAVDFNRLQAKLVSLWEEIVGGPGGPIQGENTVVVVPSLSIDIMMPAAKLHAYEQRLLFMLFLLRQPRLRLIYVTSMPVQQAIIDYHLAVMPGVAYSNARKRLHMVCVDDSTGEPLSKKLLQRPHVLREIQSLIPDLDRGHIVPFTTTDLERELALRLDMPMYAADPAFYALGTKSGGRRIFAEEGVRYPLGYENLYSENELGDAIRRMRAEKPELKAVIVKLNDAVSGMGNASINLGTLPPPGDAGERAAIDQALQTMYFELPEIDDWRKWCRGFAKLKRDA